LNIAIDVMGICLSRNRGIGNYTIDQFRALFEIDKHNQYFIFNLYENVSLNEELHYGNNVREFYFNIGNNNSLWKYTDLIGNLFKKFIQEHKIDLFYITSPADLNYLLDKSWFTGIKYVVTVYDIIPYIFSDKYLTTMDIEILYKKALDLICNADYLLAISQCVKNDLIKYLNVKPDKINVIYAGVNTKKFKFLDVSEEEKNIVKKKYSISDKFIICVGGDENRKNLDGLINAYSRLPHNTRLQYQLVIVCSLSEAGELNYRAIAKNHNVLNRVIFTNYVSDNDLVLLYNMATVSVFVSKYEGFGLPVLESMVCGTPVLTSNNSSLEEIAGDAAILVDPYNIDDITQGITKILSAKLDELRKAGFSRAENFSWEKTAKMTYEVINQIKPLSLSFQTKLTLKNLAFFTPLPPIQSGISDYSYDILCQLTKYCDVDIFIDKDYNPDCKLPKNVRVYPHTLFETKFKNYTQIIFQVGNSTYHEYMFNYIKKYSGTVVLHDYNLHGILHAIKDRYDFNWYKENLLYDYNESGISKILNSLSKGDFSAITDNPVNGFVSNFTKRIIVHSKWAKKQLLFKYIGKDIMVIPLYAHIPKYTFEESKSVQLSARKKLQLSEKDIYIMAFGQIDETKRSMPSLSAFKKVINEIPDVKMVFCGKFACNDLKQSFYFHIKENQMQNNVLLTEFVSLETFLLYMEASDICLNLRYPYNGENSGSLARLLAAGKCVLINDIGSFSEIPDSCCIKLPVPEYMSSAEEELKIYEALISLITDAEKRIEIGRQARIYAENKLDINKVIPKYIKALSLPYRQKVLTNTMLVDIYENNKIQSEEDWFSLTKTLAYTL